MYIRSVHIQNIRCIEHLGFAFEDGHEAGWHVIIGENGTGKTTVVRAIGLTMMSEKDMEKLVISTFPYVRTGTDLGGCVFEIIRDPIWDTVKPLTGGFAFRNDIEVSIAESGPILGEYAILASGFEGKEEPSGMLLRNSLSPQETVQHFMKGAPIPHLALAQYVLKYAERGWMVIAFGASRRFRGGSNASDDFLNSHPRASGVVGLYQEDTVYAEIEPWIQKLYTQGLEGKNKILQNLRNFINDGALLPNGVRLNGISSDGVFFEDSEGKKVNLHDLSDGYRSVLSITFELVRQLVRSYGEQSVFANIEQGNMNIPLPGVVIIDEIDAHLHPTWQTRVGQWFTQYFPKLQFIVTTHSPLICRASGEHGKIFQLATPDSEHPSREITGIERDRLVYGDILDAYSTDLFGKDIERGQEGRDLQEEYRQLVYKDRYGMPMSQSEQDRFDYLTQLFRFNVDHSRSRVK